MNNNCFCPIAKAVVTGGAAAPQIRGTVKFYQKKNHVLVQANIIGLPQSASGFFGFHIHKGGNCSGAEFSGTGSHFNPENAPHPEHAGDLPPLMLCGDRACMTVATDRFCLADIIGRTVVIHSGTDDFHTQPAGNAGEKIACGVITKA